MRPLFVQGIPFRNLNARQRENLGFVAVAFFYVIYLAWMLTTLGLLAGVGGDYLGLWSAGVVANQLGYARVYDLEVMRRVEEGVVPLPQDSSLVFVPMPVPFLPVFLLPFQFLALLDARTSFGLWTAVNVALLLWYLRWFIRRTCGHPSEKRLLIAAMLSFPVFVTLFEGQVNVFLTICVGEFLRATGNGRPLRAGIWLGGLLLKPQFLILILPALLVQRAWKSLIGFAVSACVFIVVSFGLVGREGVIHMMQLWIGYSGGLATNAPENMMNWRMVIVRLSTLGLIWLGWSIGMAGILLSLLAVGFLWRTPISPRSADYTIAVLGTLAGTGVITWHSHIHMLILLIPPLLFVSRHWQSKAVWNLYVFSLPLAAFLGLVVGLLVKTGAVLPLERSEWFIPALVALGLNLYILVSSCRALERSRRGEGSL